MSNRTFKSFFMPKLCRFSLNDAVKPTNLSDSSSHDPSSPKLGCTGQIKKRSKTTTNNINSNNNDNNRRINNNSNRFLTCNFSASTSTRSSGHSNRYNKLENLFSSKRLISPAIDTSSINYSNNHNNSNRFLSNRYTKLDGLGRKLVSPVIDNASINSSCKSTCVTKRSKSCNGRGSIPISKKKYYMNSSNDYDIVKVTVAGKFDPPLPVVKCHQRDQEVNVNLSKRRGIQIKTLQIQPIQATMSQNTNNNNGQISLPTI